MSNAAGVDYGYWAKMAYWNVGEAVALSLGIDPLFVEGFNACPALLGAIYGMEFARVLALVERAFSAGLLTEPLMPGHFVDWASAVKLAMPSELTEALNDQRFAWYGTVAQDHRGQTRSGRGDVRVNRTMPEPKEEAFNKKSLNTLLRMVGGMAMAVYGYEPEGGRSSVVSEIQTDLDLKGINLDLDTIRKWLKEAGSLLRADALRQAKPKSVFSE